MTLVKTAGSDWHNYWELDPDHHLARHLWTADAPAIYCPALDTCWHLQGFIHTDGTKCAMLEVDL